MSYVRGHRRRTRKGYVSVRSHNRKRSRKPRLNYFYANKGVFGAIGISPRHGPYALIGAKQGPVKIKTSVGLQGHKVNASVKPTRNTEVGVTRNLTFNKTSVNLRHKKRKIEL